MWSPINFIDILFLPCNVLVDYIIILHTIGIILYKFFGDISWYLSQEAISHYLLSKGQKNCHQFIFYQQWEGP